MSTEMSGPLSGSLHTGLEPGHSRARSSGLINYASRQVTGQRTSARAKLAQVYTTYFTRRVLEADTEHMEYAPRSHHGSH